MSVQTGAPETRLPSFLGPFQARPYATLFVLCMIFYLPGLFSLPPLDRDESRFAQASKQMLETGDYVNIRYLTGARNKKPAGIHWMQAGTAYLAGGPEKAGIWAYRLPSVVGATIAIFLLYWAGCRLFGRDVAFLAAGLMAGTMSIVAETNISKTDGVLIATVIAAQGALARYYLHAHNANRMNEGAPGLGTALIFWIAIGISALIKGPIGPMVIGVTVLALSLTGGRGWSFLESLNWRFAFIILGVLVLLHPIYGTVTYVMNGEADFLQAFVLYPLVTVAMVLGRGALQGMDWSWLTGIRWRMGLLIVAAIFLPWGLAILFETQGAYYEESIGKDLVGKVVSAQESHGAPPGYYLLLVTLTFFPASIFLWPALRHAWRERFTPAVHFCLAWLIPTWALFESFPTKLPHYSLPAYPALALLVAATVMAAVHQREILISALGRINLGVWLVLGLMISAAASLLPYLLGDGLEPWSIPLSIIGAVLVIAVAIAAWRGAFVAAAAGSVVAAAALFAPLLEIALPNVDRLAVSPRIASMLEKHYGPDKAKWPWIASTGYVEPSLVFLVGTKTVLATAKGAADYLEKSPDPENTVALVESRNEERFRRRLDAKGQTVTPIDTVEGFNYSNGRAVTITLYRLADGADE